MAQGGVALLQYVWSYWRKCVTVRMGFETILQASWKLVFSWLPVDEDVELSAWSWWLFTVMETLRHRVTLDVTVMFRLLVLMTVSPRMGLSSGACCHACCRLLQSFGDVGTRQDASAWMCSSTGVSERCYYPEYFERKDLKAFLNSW